jgi:hypothetical protein
VKKNLIAASIIAAGIAFGSVGQVSAIDVKKDINVYLNNEEVDFTNSPNPIIFDDVTYISLRQLFEGMGANVSWDVQGYKRFAKVEKGNQTIEFYEGKNVAIVNGKEMSASKPLKIVDGRLMIPLRYVSETFGANVKWDNQTKTIYINETGSDEQTSNKNEKMSAHENNFVWKDNADGVMVYEEDTGRTVGGYNAYPDNEEHRLEMGRLAEEKGFPLSAEEFAKLPRDNKLFEDPAKEHNDIDGIVYVSYIQGGPGLWVVKWVKNR